MSDQPATAAQYVVTFLKPEMLHVYRQITGLRRFRPVVVCQKRENAGRFPFEDLVVLPKPRTHQLRRIWQKSLLHRPITIYGSEAREILQILREQKASLLHIYFGHIGVHLLPLLELLAENPPSYRIPVIVSFHGADADVDLQRPAHRDSMARMFALASLLLVRSESLGKRLQAHGAPVEKIRIHRTGIPVHEIPFRERIAPENGAWKFLQACRLIPKKGLRTSLLAFAVFARSWPQATFTVAGDGPLMSDLRTLAEQLGVAKKVAFTGFVTQEALRESELDAHLFIHPSERTLDGDQEGIPNSMLEAMASGLPVLSTTHGGIPEAVDHDINGYLVPEGDHEALARAMQNLATNSENLVRLSHAARAKVSTLFDSAMQVERLEGIYREITK